MCLLFQKVGYEPTKSGLTDWAADCIRNTRAMLTNMKHSSLIHLSVTIYDNSTKFQMNGASIEQNLI
jgi:hypothetical protein